MQNLTDLWIWLPRVSMAIRTAIGMAIGGLSIQLSACSSRHGRHEIRCRPRVSGICVM